MLGTLARLLAGKGVPTPEEYFGADVEGDIENVDGVLKITQIRVKYDLKVPKGTVEAVQEVLDSYITFCPGAQSVIGCIDIIDQADIEELAE